MVPGSRDFIEFVSLVPGACRRMHSHHSLLRVPGRLALRLGAASSPSRVLNSLERAWVGHVRSMEPHGRPRLEVHVPGRLAQLGLLVGRPL